MYFVLPFYLSVSVNIENISSAGSIVLKFNVKKEGYPKRLACALHQQWNPYRGRHPSSWSQNSILPQHVHRKIGFFISLCTISSLQNFKIDDDWISSSELKRSHPITTSEFRPIWKTGAEISYLALFLFHTTVHFYSLFCKNWFPLLNHNNFIMFI